jgi:LTXXQ motif family protein
MAAVLGRIRVFISKYSRLMQALLLAACVVGIGMYALGRSQGKKESSTPPAPKAMTATAGGAKQVNMTLLRLRTYVLDQAGRGKLSQELVGELGLSEDQQQEIIATGEKARAKRDMIIDVLKKIRAADAEAQKLGRPAAGLDDLLKQKQELTSEFQKLHTKAVEEASALLTEEQQKKLSGR